MRRKTLSAALILLLVWISISLLSASSHENDSAVALIMSNFPNSSSYDVWLVDAITGEQTHIRQLHGYSSLASWSPSGRYVTLSNKRDSDSWYLSIYDTMTDTITVVSDHVRNMNECSANFWSPDERFIAYQTPMGLYLHEYVDGNLRDPIQLIENRPRYQRLTWSSDGRYLLFLDPQDNVVLLDLNQDVIQGNILSELEITGLHYPRFSPDGRYLLTDIANDNPAGNYALIELSTRHVHNFMTDARFLRWSTDSQYVAFTRGSNDHSPGLYFLHVADAEIYEVPLREDTRHGFSQLWGSGVYVTVGVGRDWVQVSTADNETQIVLRQSEISQYVDHFWSPDGTLLAIRTVNGDSDGSTHIHIYDVSDMRVMALVETLEIPTPPVMVVGSWMWSEDGRYLAVKGEDDVVAVDLQTGDTVALPEDPNFEELYPQGWIDSLLAFERYSGRERENALFVYDMQTHTVSPLIDDLNQLERFSGWQDAPLQMGRALPPCGSG